MSATLHNTFRNNPRASVYEQYRQEIPRLLRQHFPNPEDDRYTELQTQSPILRHIPRGNLVALVAACSYRMGDTWFQYGDRQAEATALLEYLKSLNK